MHESELLKSRIVLYNGITSLMMKDPSVHTDIYGSDITIFCMDKQTIVNGEHVHLCANTIIQTHMCAHAPPPPRLPPSPPPSPSPPPTHTHTRYHTFNLTFVAQNFLLIHSGERWKPQWLLPVIALTVYHTLCAKILKQLRTKLKTGTSSPLKTYTCVCVSVCHCV